LVNNEHNNTQNDGAIGSGSEQWLLTAALAYSGKAAVVKIVSGSGSGG
jgi:hypothetical protein